MTCIFSLYILYVIFYGICNKYCIIIISFLVSARDTLHELLAASTVNKISENNKYITHEKVQTQT